MRYLIWGKSLSFYTSTELRMPLDAKIVADVENSPLPDSNEGEELVVFDIKPSQVAAYLARAPWREDAWHKGPIPPEFVDEGAQLVRPFWSLWHSPHLRYTAYGKDNDYFNGHLLVVDATKGRVFFLSWNQKR
ncbi:MAG: hypothetical protein EOO38_11880 [Cytophagaceae bacterium]|nr:MAG: hypothetical protein EOO38_11880 [Cytophagaceae bacterium]